MNREAGANQLVISDAHRGLVNATGTVMEGAAWQRCRVHFMHNVLAKVSQGHDETVAATIRTIFAQPGPKEVRAQVHLVASMLASQYPTPAPTLLEPKTTTLDTAPRKEIAATA